MPLKKLSHGDYTAAWMAPLLTELIAAYEMLDEEHEALAQAPDDRNAYKLGSINGHNVVITNICQPDGDTRDTAIVRMRKTFPNLEYGLVVGLGGGVPRETSSGVIRLGHVVVSEPAGGHSGAVIYDVGRAKEACFEMTGCIAAPPEMLLDAVNDLAADRARRGCDVVWEDTKRIKADKWTFRSFEFPGVGNDVLYRSDYAHERAGVSCEEAGCSPDQRIKRPVVEDGTPIVVVHRGTIASGGLVIKDAALRDSLAESHGVVCFEMKPVGALGDFPCLVVRGVSSYCGSHASDLWHGFAAAAAAAYARRLFFYLPGKSVSGLG